MQGSSRVRGLPLTGSLTSERAFTANDLFDANSSLSNLVVSTVLAGGFDSGITSYTMGAFHGLTSVTFQASDSVPGQWIRYSWNGSALMEIVPDTPSPNLFLVDNAAVIETDNTLNVQVTAPDRVTTKDYVVKFSRDFSLAYDGNGNDGGTVPSGLEPV